MWAVIGGSGFENFEGFEVLEELDRNTPFGLCSNGFKRARFAGQEILFLSRHGQHHELLPSEINYRANIFALKRYGASKIVSISAVGSLREELKPGDMVVPRYYIDRTKSIRRHTFCGEGVVGHVALAEPITVALMQVLEKIHLPSINIHFGKTYVCIEGPCFSTRAESNYYRSIGADIIGMTNFPEYALAREAGICYLPCAFITDYDGWDESIPHVTIDEVMNVMRLNKQKAFSVLKALLPMTKELFLDGCSEHSLREGLICDFDGLNSAQKEWVSVILAKSSEVRSAKRSELHLI